VKVPLLSAGLAELSAVAISVNPKSEAAARHRKLKSKSLALLGRGASRRGEVRADMRHDP
jgi:hypothetical protein